MGFLPPVIVELKATITEFQAKMGEAKAELDSMQSKGESTMSQFKSFGAAAFLAVGAAAVGLGAEALHLADTFEISHARLTASLTANGLSFDAWKGQIGAADNAGQKLGFTNAQVEDGLARLETMVKNPTVALKDLAVAEDIARARGIDLTSAAQLVGKASEGTYTALVRLGVVTKDQATAFTSGAEAVDFLGKAFGGQAAAYADTFAGKLQVLKATSEDVGKNIGLALIPIIETLASGLASGIHFLSDHATAFANLAKVVMEVAVPAFAAWVIAQHAVIVAGIADFIIATVTGLTVMVSAIQAVTTELLVMGVAANSALGWIGLVVGLGVALLGLGTNVDDVSSKTQAWVNSFVQGLGPVADKVAALTQEQKLLMVQADELAAHGTGNWGPTYQTLVDRIQGLDGAIKAARDSTAAFAAAQNMAATAADGASAADISVGITKSQLKEQTLAAKDAAKAFADAQKDLAEAVKSTTQAVKDTTTATNDYFNAAVTADQASAAWTLSLDALKTALKTNGDTLDVNTVAGAKNRQAIDTLVTATDKLIEKELASGDTADQMRTKIQGYVDKFDLATTSVGLTTKQVAALNTQYGLTPTSINTEISVNVSAAEASLAALAAQAKAAFSAAGGSAGIIGGSYSLPAGYTPPVTPPTQHRAGGGPTAAGQPYIVGENGPELFMPDLGGTIVNDARIQAALIGITGSDYATQVVRQTIGQANLAMAALSRMSATASAAGGSGGANAQLMQQMAAARGWAGAEWNALYAVEMREAGFNQFARNAASGAYGMPQALPESKLPFAGQAAGGSDPGAQIAWMLDYIAGRYGSPSGAWNHEVSAGWYDQGGKLPQGLSLALNTTGHDEIHTGGGGLTVNVEVHGNVASVNDLATAVRHALLRQGRSIAGLGLS